MESLDDLVRRVRGELHEEYHARLRASLTERPKEWLVEQLLARAAPDAPSPALPAARAPQPEPESRPQPEPDAESEEERARRLERIRAWKLDAPRLADFVAELRSWDRERLEAEGHLLDPPPKGGGLVPARCRSATAGELLRTAKDLLYALLFGDAEAGVELPRVERELLTLTMPRAKAHAVSFLMRAATEIGAVGTWRDPRRRADDERAPNVLVQVEYGEVAGELVGSGIAAALRLINNLEVNEQVLYARMENVEESTLE
ncbi:MAG TPA: hypothetical protein VE546_12030 [Streptomyces sp.]|uniref:hypothetical protein n=1 Tax=Streptomyces sp. TaxID=1931 RepID=UPI002D5204EC|nr:hypothetical protein [Streptomyces sp.]HZG04283.1 hypothetical protein [Streptomyces sp.]